MINSIYFIISISFVFFSMLGYGLLFYKKTGKQDLFFNLLSGYFLIGTISLLIHFVNPINIYVSVFVLVIGLFILFTRLKYLGNFKILKKTTLFILISFILIAFSDHPIDTNMYHHPYVSYLKSEKIIFGIAEVQFRFGHISFLQYVQAITTNEFLHVLSIASPNLILYVFFLFFCLNTISKKKERKILFLLTILISSFVLIKLSRYREFGNDILPFIICSYILIRIVEQIFYEDDNRLKIILASPILTTFIFAHKISYVFIFPLFFAILKKKDLIKIIKKPFLLFFFLVFSFAWLFKSFINTSCLAYPVVITCIENTSWYLTGISDPKKASWLTELWAKDFITKENWKSLNLEQYINTFEWVPNWMQNHFIKILEKLSPLIAVCIIIYIFLVLNIKTKVKLKSVYNYKLLFLLSLICIGLLIWFLKAPVFRYGSFYIVSFVCLIFLFSIQKLIMRVPIEIILKLRVIVLIAVVFFIGKNFERHLNNKNKDFFPLTRPSINEYYLFEINGLKIVKPKTLGVCYYSYEICSHELKETTKFSKTKGYYFLTKK